MGDGASPAGEVPENDAAIWAVPPANMLTWRVFDAEFLVYNTASGQTHHLNFLAGEALRSLEVEAATTHQLVSRLAEQFEIAEDNPSLQMIDSLVRELEDLGLIASSIA